MKKKIVAMVFGMMMTASGYAVETKDFIHDCRVRNFECFAYVNGTIDTLITLKGWGLLEKKDIGLCVPEEVTMGQIIDALDTFLITNPENLKHTTSSVVIGFLAETYPCVED